MSQIDIKNITTGHMDGEIIWVCDFRQEDIHKKPIRKVVPTEVIVRPATDTKNTIYYSQSYMSPLSKTTREPLAQEIKVFDNTGYRSFSGVALSAFTTQEECQAHFDKQCDVIIEQYQSALLSLAASYQTQIDTLTKLKAKPK